MDGRRRCGLGLAAAFTVLFACGDDGVKRALDSGTTPPESVESILDAAASGAVDAGQTKPEQEPMLPQREFVSADPPDRPGGHEVFEPGGVSGDVGGPDDGASPAPSQRAVSRGDIFRVLSDQRILSLNQYRGLQVIDVRNLNVPHIEGQLSVAGYPVEMYVLGDRAFVLINGWFGYYGSRDAANVRAANGGLVMSVDIRDRANPKLIDQSVIQDGSILTSRLAQGSDSRAALYVAGTYASATFIKSFEVSTGELIEKSELELSGYVQDIQATTDLMLVASADTTKLVATSTVTVIDISSTDGTLVQGGSVTAQGFVGSKFNMDAYNGVLRIASGAQLGGTQENRVETFSLADLQHPTPIASCLLTPRDPTARDEQLYASVFLENRAFFVTYYRQDPFHAVSIDDAGQCEEHGLFVVSGWNNFLRPALGGTRLLGTGYNDANDQRLLSVSLYDAVNLDNPSPLLARADIALGDTRSEADWDDRAFSVLEDAVSIQAADGTEETGLLLLPFAGWDSARHTPIAEVQLFTFSSTTLTKRGIMDHGTLVRRSIGVQTDTTANISDEALSLFDIENPDQPAELGRVELARNHSRVFVFGEHVARLRYDLKSFESGQNNALQLVAAAGDIETNPVLSELEVPALGSLTQVGALLVSVLSDTTVDQNGLNPKMNSQIKVWDLTDPRKPRERGALQTDQLTALGVTSELSSSSGPYVVGQAIVFPGAQQQKKSLGFARRCENNPLRRCDPAMGGQLICENPYVKGGTTCVTPEGGTETCWGEFYQCDDTTGECKVTDPPAETNHYCYQEEQFRFWDAYSFESLDLRDPDQPKLGERIELPLDEEGTAIVADGGKLYVSTQKPHEMPNDDRSYVKHYVRLLGYADPQKVVVSEPINLPGDVIAVRETTLFTRDFVWQDQAARTSVARVELKADRVDLRASKLFEDVQVSKVIADGAGHMLVSSHLANDPNSLNKLSILNEGDLSLVSEAELGAWAQLRDATHGRALFHVAGGLLVLDTRDAAQPRPQAFFPVSGWPSDIAFDGESILFAADFHGIHRLNADVFNLLAP